MVALVAKAIALPDLVHTQLMNVTLIHKTAVVMARVIVRSIVMVMVAAAVVVALTTPSVQTEKYVITMGDV